MATAAPAVKKVSWLKKIGQFMGEVLGVVAKDAKPVADTASKFAALIFPQFATEIGYAENLVTKIATEAVAVEGMAAAQGQASGTGAQKLEALVHNVGPAIDAWVQGNFPGAKKVSAAVKAGLSSAIVDIINELEPTSVVPEATATTVAAPTSAAAPTPAPGPTLVPATNSAAPAASAPAAAVGETGAHGEVGDTGTNKPA